VLLLASSHSAITNIPFKNSLLSVSGQPILSPSTNSQCTQILFWDFGAI